MPTIRPYRPDDLSALYDVCLRTGASGADATDLHDDPDLLGHVYAGPYGVHAPQHAFVVEDDDGVAGYVLGAADSRGFEAELEAAWWPPLRTRYPRVVAGRRPADQRCVDKIHEPDRAPGPIVAVYPSHLHIDLLPRVQGQGWGRRLLDELFSSLRDAGSSGVHLGVAASNTGAIAFYEATGFSTAFANDEGRLMVRPL